MGDLLKWKIKKADMDARNLPEDLDTVFPAQVSIDTLMDAQAKHNTFFTKVGQVERETKVLQSRIYKTAE